MTKCTFCGQEKHASMGIHYIKNDGTVNYFCSSKCRKNALKLKRDKRKLKWAEAFHVAREKARSKAREKTQDKAKEKSKDKESEKEK